MNDVIIIGAGPSGLAVAMCLQARGISALVLDRETQVGSAWARHYDRLHLHTARNNSNLPLHPMPADWPRYVPREQVLSYLQDYAARLKTKPLLGTYVTKLEEASEGWHVTHDNGVEKTRALVLATGFADTPKIADWPGQHTFPGPTLHSRDYRRPSDLAGQRVLVVGFGNSGGEIALDLAEDGRDVTMAVRSPVNILPKELFGRPIAEFSLAQKLFGYKVADWLAAPLMSWAIGNPKSYGLKQAPKGPLAQIVEDNRIPLIDVGALKLIRQGRITVRGGITHSKDATIYFEEGNSMFDAILMATGYTVDLRPLMGDHLALDTEGRPPQQQAPFAPGLWGISYHAVPNGQLAAIARQAPIIAKQISEYLAE